MMGSSEKVPCPHCGEEINKNARACPYCGSDDKTGWSDDSYMDGIDTGLDDDEYKETAAREFGDGTAKPGKNTWIVITGIIILAVFVLGMLLSVYK